MARTDPGALDATRAGVEPAARRSRNASLLLVVSALGFVGLGLLDGAGGAVWTDVLHAFHVSTGLFGVASAAGLAMAFPVLFLGGTVADRGDKRLLLAFAFGLMAVAALGLVVGSGIVALFALLLIRGLGVSLLDLGSNALAMDYERASRRHVLSPLHGTYSGGTMVGAVLVWAIFGLGGGFRVVYLGLTVFYVLGAMATRLPRRPEETAAVPASASSPLALGLFRHPVVRLLASICALSFVGEALVGQWTSLYLREERGFSPRVAALALGAYGGAMLVGRMASGPLAARIPTRTLLLVSGAVTAVGGVLVVAGGPVAISILGCGVAGLGFASMVPLALSLGSNATFGGTGATSGALLGAGYLAMVVGPLVAGGLATAISLRAVLVLVPLAGAGVLVLAWRLGGGVHDERVTSAEG